MSIFRDRDFWIGTIDKSIIAFANGALAVLTAGAVGILEINPVDLASIGGLSAAIAFMTSISTAATGIQDPQQRLLTDEPIPGGRRASSRQDDFNDFTGDTSGNGRRAATRKDQINALSEIK